MSTFPSSLERLIEAFARLPGVGSKSAQRMAFYILSLDMAEAKSFADAIMAAKGEVHRCSVCQNLTDSDICPVCSDHRRNQSVICVVSDPKDLIAMERSREYSGVYHVLHGAISPMSGIGAEDIKLKELVKRLDGEVSEVIVATNPTVEGETTAMYISKLLKPLGVKVTRIAHGIPVGGDLEYADEITLARALQGRREI